MLRFERVLIYQRFSNPVAGQSLYVNGEFKERERVCRERIYGSIKIYSFTVSSKISAVKSLILSTHFSLTG